jgi:hypothetical protein
MRATVTESKSGVKIYRIIPDHLESDTKRGRRVIARNKKETNNESAIHPRKPAEIHNEISSGCRLRCHRDEMAIDSSVAVVQLESCVSVMQKKCRREPSRSGVSASIYQVELQFVFVFVVFSGHRHVV